MKKWQKNIFYIKKYEEKKWKKSQKVKLEKKQNKETKTKTERMNEPKNLMLKE